MIIEHMESTSLLLQQIVMKYVDANSLIEIQYKLANLCANMEKNPNVTRIFKRLWNIKRL